MDRPPRAVRQLGDEPVGATAIVFLLLAVYLPPLRAALRLGIVSPAQLGISVLLALLLVSPAELRKVFSPASLIPGEPAGNFPRPGTLLTTPCDAPP
jgi:uncharacterized membrane protein YqaE (UPF0057 family)